MCKQLQHNRQGCGMDRASGCPWRCAPGQLPGCPAASQAASLPFTGPEHCLSCTGCCVATCGIWQAAVFS